MAFFGSFLDAPRACPLIAMPIFLEMVGGGMNLGQVSFTSDLWFLSFQFANVFVPQESWSKPLSLFRLKNEDILERFPPPWVSLNQVRFN